MTTNPTPLPEHVTSLIADAMMHRMLCGCSPRFTTERHDDDTVELVWYCTGPSRSGMLAHITASDDPDTVPTAHQPRLATPPQQTTVRDAVGTVGSNPTGSVQGRPRNP